MLPPVLKKPVKTVKKVFEPPKVDYSAPVLPREERRKPKLRFSLLGLVKSKQFWFNAVMILVSVIGEVTEPIRAVVGDKATSLLLILAAVVNVYFKVTAMSPVAANTEAGRADLEAAKRGQ